MCAPGGISGASSASWAESGDSLRGMSPKKTRILFVKYHEAADQQPLSRKSAEKLGIFPSLALSQLAAWVRENGFSVQIIDLHAENIFPHQAAARVTEYAPHIVALTAKTLGWPAVLDVARMVRVAAPEATIVVGGPHLSIYPQESLSWDCFDVAVVGDGEETFLEICQRVESGSELEGTPGTWLRKTSGELVQAPPRPPVHDLDRYPFPAFDLLPMDRYHALTVLLPMATMATSRGCPFHCGYCSQVYSERLRFQSPERVVEEMAWLERRFGVREIVMFDETFTIGKGRMLRFAEEVRRRDLKVKFNIRARVDTVDREVLRALKDAGLRSIHMGVEAGNDRMLGIMNKQITTDQVVEAFKAARDVGVETRGYFIIGYYDATPRDLQDTIDFACTLGLDWASFSVATPLPATDLYEVSMRRGYIQGDFWRQYTLEGGGELPQLQTETFSAEELRRWRTKAYLSFYLRPDLVRRKLSMTSSRRELLDMLGGVQVLGDIVKTTLLKRVPRTGTGKLATV